MTKTLTPLERLINSVEQVFAGTDHNYNKYAYVETGRYKPWSEQSVKALAKRGYVVERRCPGVYYVYPKNEESLAKVQAAADARQALFREALIEKERLGKVADDASKLWNDFCNQYAKGAMGLTPDHVKAMPEYKRLSEAYFRAHGACRRYNQVFLKNFKKEYNEEIRARRAAKIAANKA